MGIAVTDDPNPKLNSKQIRHRIQPVPKTSVKALIPYVVRCSCLLQWF